MATTVDLTRTTRDTLTSLRSAIDQAAVASNRISTGKRVNDPSDDPASYFTSQKLSTQAQELDRTLEQVGQAVQVVKAADDGLTSIGKLLENANAMIVQAGASGSAFSRAEFAKNYNSLLSQIEDLAKDSGYRGKNLLLGEGHDLKLYFGAQASEAVTIQASDLTDLAKTLGLPRVEEGRIATLQTKLESGGSPLGPNDSAAAAAGVFAAGDTIAITRAGDGKVLTSARITADTKLSDLASALTDLDAGVRATIGEDGVFRIESVTGATVSGGSAGGPLENAALDATPSAWFDATATTAQEAQMKAAREQLRLQSVSFGTNLTMLQNRERFMKEFSGTLTTGSESVVAADLNEEGAKLLALQVRQQFSSNAMSFATEADQGVLRLLGG